jgi:PadR family transcriptional regulator PadR
VEGTVYPLLTRLKNGGLLEYNWKESNSGHHANITALQLQVKPCFQLLESWNQLVKVVSKTTKK